jgi:hypothetical protein
LARLDLLPQSGEAQATDKERQSCLNSPATAGTLAARAADRAQFLDQAFASMSWKLLP